MMSDEILNIKKACDLLGIHQRTMYSLLKEGKIPAVKIGGQWRFSRQVLLDLFHQGAHNFDNVPDSDSPDGRTKNSSSQSEMG